MIKWVRERLLLILTLVLVIAGCTQPNLHEFYITVVGGRGNPISATFTVPHRLGEAGEALCHHVVL